VAAASNAHCASAFFAATAYACWLSGFAPRRCRLATASLVRRESSPPASSLPSNIVRLVRHTVVVSTRHFIVVKRRIPTTPKGPRHSLVQLRPHVQRLAAPRLRCRRPTPERAVRLVRRHPVRLTPERIRRREHPCVPDVRTILWACRLVNRVRRHCATNILDSAPRLTLPFVLSRARRPLLADGMTAEG